MQHQLPPFVAAATTRKELKATIYQAMNCCQQTTYMPIPRALPLLDGYLCDVINDDSGVVDNVISQTIGS